MGHYKTSCREFLSTHVQHTVARPLTKKDDQSIVCFFFLFTNFRANNRSVFCFRCMELTSTLQLKMKLFALQTIMETTWFCRELQPLLLFGDLSLPVIQ